MVCSVTVRVARWVIPVGYAAAVIAYPFVGMKRAEWFAIRIVRRGIRVKTTAA